MQAGGNLSFLPAFPSYNFVLEHKVLSAILYTDDPIRVHGLYPLPSLMAIPSSSLVATSTTQATQPVDHQEAAYRTVCHRQVPNRAEGAWSVALYLLP